MKFLRFLSSILVFILSLYLVSGCKAGRPARATLPDQLDNRGLTENNWDEKKSKSRADNYSLPGLPFYAVDTTIDGKSFTAIYLRNADFDSLAFSIVKSYEPFAASLMKIVADQGIEGVLIDFRQSGENTQGEAKFSVAKYSEQELNNNINEPLSVVFLWDEVSASRAAGFMNELNTSSSLSVKTISNTGVISSRYKQDCFRPGSANFEDQ